MKSTVIEKEVKKGEGFPRIIKHKENGRLILLSSEGTGTVIHKGDGEFPVGHYSDKWQIPYYIEFKGQVILEQ